MSLMVVTLERTKRTANISSIVRTLNVSKLSGWLNDDAPCAESKISPKIG